jgi:pSer/pThr/pTyr-binding forkhead associated (FHA) protein
VWLVVRSRRRARRKASGAPGGQPAQGQGSPPHGRSSVPPASPPHRQAAPPAQDRRIAGTAGTPHLVVVQGAASASSVALVAGRAVVGRDASCTLVLQDGLASRQHASVAWENGAWVVTDLNSTNGTYVNGTRIARQALHPGDQIQIGSVRLAFMA